jgi:hypothetical protein
LDADKQTMHLLFVTDGVALEYPPELYARQERAELEAERWAWFLSGSGWLDIERPFDGRWTVGDRDVSLVQVAADTTGECWVGQFRTRDGYLDPEAIIFPERDSALAWVTAPLHGVIQPTEIVELPWFVAATYPIRGEDAYAIASLAKVVT